MYYITSFFYVDRQRGQRLHRIEEEIVRRKHERRPLELYIPAGDQGHTCETERDGTQPMTCPSASNVCLYDSMICDGSNDCPGGEDETFPLCVLRHWTFRWLRHFHAMFGTPRS
ncbi:uncharacterized protein LOC106011608 [Aplysia californica]|uniref:Uncharacterized protein LOC106011608 n=1 Tax=Aplysia californica TaxID=6500 RepID=A0ABM0ZYN9_APLCA|nr:uncharacterized protein LOC106011608 [Aplysia californica]